MLLLIGRNLVTNKEEIFDESISKVYLNALYNFVDKSNLNVLFENNFIDLVINHFFN